MHVILPQVYVHKAVRKDWKGTFVIDFVNMENLELDVPKRAIVITRHVIRIRAHVHLVDGNVDIQEYPAVQSWLLWLQL